MEWRFPSDVTGWLTEAEGRKLAELAQGKTVLEIGSYCGRSTICMAQTAKHVDAVDPFDGRATPNQRDTFDEFSENIKRYGVRDRISAYRGASSYTVPLMSTRFDLAFIDGAHDYHSVLEDAKLAASKLKPDGLLVFHDYARDPDIDPGVTAAVDAILYHSGELLERCDSLAVVRPNVIKGWPKPIRPKVVLGLPSRHYLSPVALDGICRWASQQCEVFGIFASHSLINTCFNNLWAGALNLKKIGITHFAMIHDDINPERGWLDTLLRELIRLDADIVSTVLPIKDETGVTSTAVYDGDPWTRRRLTMHEVFELPETFSAEDTGKPLLLNTGLWVCDFRQPWVDVAYFRSLERIARMPNGDRIAQTVSEDWVLSDTLNQAGAKIYATRKVKALHGGFTNETPWGTWKTDEEAQGNENARRKDRGSRNGEVPTGCSDEDEGIGQGSIREGRVRNAPACVGAALD